jgi:hypothetical protein
VILFLSFYASKISFKDGGIFMNDSGCMITASFWSVFDNNLSPKNNLSGHEQKS